MYGWVICETKCIFKIIACKGCMYIIIKFILWRHTKKSEICKVDIFSIYIKKCNENKQTSCTILQFNCFLWNMILNYLPRGDPGIPEIKNNPSPWIEATMLVRFRSQPRPYWGGIIIEVGYCVVFMSFYEKWFPFLFSYSVNLKHTMSIKIRMLLRKKNIPL